MAKPDSLLNPYHKRLRENEDFKRFLAGLEQLRGRLFEEAEFHSDMEKIFETRGMRKIIKKILDPQTCDTLFEGNPKIDVRTKS